MKDYVMLGVVLDAIAAVSLLFMSGFSGHAGDVGLSVITLIVGVVNLVMGARLLVAKTRLDTVKELTEEMERRFEDDGK